MEYLSKKLTIMKKLSNTIIEKVFKSVATLGVIALIAYSCSDATLQSPQDGMSHMKVFLTDAPANYDEVNVDIQGLRIHYTPFEDDTSAADTTEDGKWIDLPMEPMMVNLLELTNGADTLLASAELEPGHYRELRLVLGDNNTVVIDSASHRLKVPSGQQSGYKIKFRTELESGEELELTIDFDASRSVHKAGKSGKYILKPVLRASADGVEADTTGSISGTVDPAESDPTIFAVMNEDTTSTQADTTGSFLLQNLAPGDYDVTIEPGDEQYADTTLSDVTVTEGEENDLGTITLSEN